MYSIVVRSSLAVILAFLSNLAIAVELPDFSSLVAKNSNAVVNISTTQSSERGNVPRNFDIPELPENSPFRDFFRRFLDELPEQRRDARSLGSGFVISNDGYIMTSAHVIVNAEEILVRLNDRREFVAEVVGADERSDVALLKVDTQELSPVKIGNPEELQVGEWVLAIGSPFGFESTATAGIVSAKGRSLPNENYVPFIQTDVAINPGNSGGPLFNLDGEVVGINAQIYSNSGGFMGLSFAVPINIAIEVADQLKSHGRVSRGWLGVLIQSVTRELAESFGMSKPIGALISEIVPNSPADKSDLEPGDIIVKYNGHELTEMSDLPPLVGITAVGEEAVIEVIRNGKTKEITVLIGELPGEGAEVSSVAELDKAEDLILGMQLRSLTKEEKKQLELDNGVLVSELHDGPAKNSGIRQGDVILQIKGTEIKSVRKAENILKDLEPGKSFPVLIRRDTRSQFLALKNDGDSTEN